MRRTMCAGFAMAVASFAGQGSFDRTLKVAGTPDVDVHTGSGRITVRGGAGAEIRIHGTIRAWPKGRGGDARIREIESNPPVEQSGATVRIGYFRNLNDRRRYERNLSIDYEIEVPRQSQIRAQAGSGQVRVEGVAGPVNANTGSGSIHMDAMAGPVDAHTGSGSVRIGQTEAARIKASTGSGGVTVRLPPAGYDLRASTGSGRITVDAPMTVRGSIDRRNVRGALRGGGVPVELRTGSGSIQVR